MTDLKIISIKKKKNTEFSACECYDNSSSHVSGRPSECSLHSSEEGRAVLLGNQWLNLASCPLTGPRKRQEGKGMQQDSYALDGFGWQQGPSLCEKTEKTVPSQKIESENGGRAAVAWPVSQETMAQLGTGWSVTYPRKPRLGWYLCSSAALARVPKRGDRNAGQC